MTGGDHNLGGVIALGAVFIAFPAVLLAGLGLSSALSDGVTGRDHNLGGVVALGAVFIGFPAILLAGLDLGSTLSDGVTGGDHNLGGVIALGAVLISFPTVLRAGLGLGSTLSDGVTGGDYDLGGVVALGAVFIGFPTILLAGLGLGSTLSDGVTGRDDNLGGVVALGAVFVGFPAVLIAGLGLSGTCCDGVTGRDHNLSGVIALGAVFISFPAVLLAGLGLGGTCRDGVTGLDFNSHAVNGILKLCRIAGNETCLEGIGRIASQLLEHIALLQASPGFAAIKGNIVHHGGVGILLADGSYQSDGSTGNQNTFGSQNGSVQIDCLLKFCKGFLCSGQCFIILDIRLQCFVQSVIGPSCSFDSIAAGGRHVADGGDQCLNLVDLLLFCGRNIICVQAVHDVVIVLFLHRVRAVGQFEVGLDGIVEDHLIAILQLHLRSLCRCRLIVEHFLPTDDGDVPVAVGAVGVAIVDKRTGSGLDLIPVYLFTACILG